jgi:SM-20-related protein
MRDRVRGNGVLESHESDLLQIFAANWLEQYPRMQSRQKLRNAAFFAQIRPALCAPAVAEIDAIFQRAAASEPLCDDVIAGADGAEAQRFMILDDFVPPILQLRLSALMEMNIWRYGWKAADTQRNHFFWHSHFAGDNDDGGEADCESELHDRQLVAPVLELWHLIKRSIGAGHVPVRVYANGHTFGDDGHVHTDATRSGHFTSLYYAHPHWETNWGGETHFFNERGDTILHSAFPKPGRLVHFSGTIPHTARAPARDCPALRSVIVIKSYRTPDGKFWGA